MKPRRKLNKPVTVPKLQLEEIIGLTVRNCNGLASNFASSRCVYIAGCVAVVYNVELGTQSHFVVEHRVPKPLSCVAISLDGRYVAVGEIVKQASVIVWDCEARSLVSELKGHQHGVVSIAFSPDGRHLVSAGSARDGYIYLWHWRSGTQISKIKPNTPSFTLISVNFTSDAKSVVIAGNSGLKICSIRSSAKSNTNAAAGLLMFGKPVGFPTQKGSSFVSLACPHWNAGDSDKTPSESSSIFALTDTGILCQLSPGFLVNKSVDLKVEKGYALSTSKHVIACACSRGIVQLFTIDTLTYFGELLYSSDKSRHNKHGLLGHDDKSSHADNRCASTFPDAVACQFSTSEKLVVIYGDHSLYVWDVHDALKPIRICVLVSHSACIWDIKTLCCENNHNASVACAAIGCSGGISFATCSVDGTIRIWDFTYQSILSDLITDSSLTYETINTAMLASSGIIERESIDIEINKQGFRSIAVSSDGKYLSAGDILGNLMIYNFQTSTCVSIQNAHGEEVLSVSFSSPYQENCMPDEICKCTYICASGGRDGMVHLYDIERDFSVIGSIDQTVPVTVVQLATSGSRIISGDINGSLIIHDIVFTNDGCKIVRHHHLNACSGALYDVFFDSLVEFAVTVGQGTSICTFDLSSGELVHSFKRSEGFGDPLKVMMDPSCSYLLCSYSNKMICMYDYLNGELVAQAVGHSEVITSIIFLPDCKHLVSVGGDSCIFVWKLPATVSERMMQRLKENSRPLSPLNIVQPLIHGEFLVCEDDDVNQENVISLENSNSVRKSQLSFSKSCHDFSAFRFSISRLPKWAQKEVVSLETISCVAETISSQIADVYDTPLARPDQVNSSLSNKAESLTGFGVEDIKRIISSVSSSETCNSQIRFLQNTDQDKSFSKKRWQTIHTVCLDLISPEGRNHSQSTLKGCFDETTKCSSVIKGQGIFSSPIRNDQHNGIKMQSVSEDGHQQDSLFDRHFSSLSAVRKVHKQSTVSKRCSSRFTVRRVLSNLRDEICNQAVVSDVSSEKSSDDAVKQSREYNMIAKTENLVNADFSISSPSIKRESISWHLNQNHFVKATPNTLDELEVVSQCRAALSGLNAAADSFHNLFSKLASLLPEENCHASPATDLLNEATRMLPSIAEKIHAVSILVHPDSRDKERQILHENSICE